MADQNTNLMNLAQYLSVNSSTVAVTGAYDGSFMGPKSFSVFSPVVGDDYVVLWTNAALSLAELKTVVAGSATPSVTATFYYGSDSSGVGGNTVIQAGVVTTNTTNGNDAVSFTNPVIAANSWVWATVTAVGGTVNVYTVSMRFT
jgi:hypothetical protein